MNPITALNGVVALDLSNLRPHEQASVMLQGDTNDFVWTIQAKADSSLSFVDMPTLTATGLAVKTFTPCKGVLYQAKVTDMGTATEVFVRTN